MYIWTLSMRLRPAIGTTQEEAWMARQHLVRFMFLSGILLAAGCGSEAPPAEEAAVTETTATPTSDIKQMVAEALRSTSDSGGSIATVFLENEQAIREANPGKDRDIAEIRLMFQNLRDNADYKAQLLPRIQSKLSGLN
jgi:hypothetical protein